MKKTLLVCCFSIMSGVAVAQQQFPVAGTADIEGKLSILKQMLEDDPESVTLHLDLANLYCGVGQAEPCRVHTQKVINLSPGSAEALRAHHAAMVGFYSAGEMQNSWASAQAALEQNPQDGLAKSFVTMLQTARDNFWNGTFPEKMSWYGYKTATEFVNQVRSGGAGMQGIDGKPDCLLTYTGRQLCWKSVPDWIGRQNILLGNGTRALLIYTEDNSKTVPSIGVTIDLPPKDITTALEYSKLIANGFIQREGVTIRGPEQIRMRGQDASLMWVEMPKGMRSAWYQFLFDRQIVSFQLITTADNYETDFAKLKSLVENLEVGLPLKMGNLAGSPVMK